MYWVVLVPWWVGTGWASSSGGTAGRRWWRRTTGSWWRRRSWSGCEFLRCRGSRWWQRTETQIHDGSWKNSLSENFIFTSRFPHSHSVQLTRSIRITCRPLSLSLIPGEEAAVWGCQIWWMRELDIAFDVAHKQIRDQCSVSVRLYIRRPAVRGWACSSCSGSWPAGWAGDPLWLQRNTTCRQNRQTARQQTCQSSRRAGRAASLTWTRWTGSRWSHRRWTEPRRSAWWRRTSPATSLQTSEEQNDRRTQWRVRLSIRTVTYCLILCHKTWMS